MLTAPLILRAILKEAKTPDEIVRIALQMRDTTAAKRFKNACSRLNESIINEEFEFALNEIGLALKNLSSEISSPPNEVIYSLLSVASTGLKEFAIPTASASLPGGTLMKAGKNFYDWWHKRKYSFVSKVVDQARKAKSLNTELKRIFKKKLSSDEVSILSEMEKFR